MACTFLSNQKHTLRFVFDFCWREPGRARGFGCGGAAILWLVCWQTLRGWPDIKGLPLHCGWTRLWYGGGGICTLQAPTIEKGSAFENVRRIFGSLVWFLVSPAVTKTNFPDSVCEEKCKVLKIRDKCSLYTSFSEFSSVWCDMVFWETLGYSHLAELCVRTHCVCYDGVPLDALFWRMTVWVTGDRWNGNVPTCSIVECCWEAEMNVVCFLARLPAHYLIFEPNANNFTNYCLDRILFVFHAFLIAKNYFIMVVHSVCLSSALSPQNCEVFHGQWLRRTIRVVTVKCSVLNQL